jgi:hypothetical protein
MPIPSGPDEADDLSSQGVKHVTARNDENYSDVINTQNPQVIGAIYAYAQVTGSVPTKPVLLDQSTR